MTDTTREAQALVDEWAIRERVFWVTRSYGVYTTAPVSYEAMTKLVAVAITEQAPAAQPPSSQALTEEQIEAMVQAKGRDIYNPAWLAFYRRGIVDACAAVASRAPTAQCTRCGASTANDADRFDLCMPDPERPCLLTAAKEAALSPQERLRREGVQLCQRAAAAGFTLRIDLLPVTPLAMGNHVPLVHVYPKRGA